jgi:trimeric autotransporter adhesin
VMLLPNITVVKSSSVISDPINGVSASAKAIPGAEVQYTIQVINSGNGVADADSIVITDPVPANTIMYVDTAGSAVTFTCGGCGLTDPWTYANAVSYSYQPGGGPPYVYPPTTIGYDPLVKGVRITPSGTLNGGGASFTVIFKMKIK